MAIDGSSGPSDTRRFPSVTNESCKKRGQPEALGQHFLVSVMPIMISRHPKVEVQQKIEGTFSF
jgi:hypothetical protein